MNKHIKGFYQSIGLPRLIILSFFIVVLFGAAFYDMDVVALMSNVLRRWGMYGILVLAMVPSIQCGIGPNFGVSLGIVCGLFGSLVSIELDIANLSIFAFQRLHQLETDRELRHRPHGRGVYSLLRSSQARLVRRRFRLVWSIG